MDLASFEEDQKAFLELVIAGTEKEIAVMEEKARETESRFNSFTPQSIQTVSVTNDTSDNAEITDRDSKVMDDGKSDHNGYHDTKGGHGVNVRYENHKGKQRSRKRRPKKKGSKKLKRPENLCKYLFTKKGCYTKNCKFNHGKWAGRRRTAGVTITDSQVSNVNNTMYAAVKSAMPMSSQMITNPVPQVSPHAQMLQNPMPKMASQLNQSNDGHVTSNCYFMESKYQSDYAKPRMTPYGVTSSMTSAAPSNMVPYWNKFSTQSQSSHAQNMKLSSKKKLSTVAKVKKRNAFAKMRYQIKKLKAENRLLKTEEYTLTEEELARKSQIISEFQNSNGRDEPVMTSQFVSMTSPSHVPEAPGPSFGGDGTDDVCRNERPVRQQKLPRVEKPKFAPIVDKLSMSTTPDHNLVDQNYNYDDSGYDKITESSISDHENENEHSKVQKLGPTDVNITSDDVVQAYYNEYGYTDPYGDRISDNMQMSRDQNDDATLQKIKQFLLHKRNGKPVGDIGDILNGADEVPYKKYAIDMALGHDTDTLYILNHGPPRIVIPKKMISILVHNAHDLMGHQGISRMRSCLAYYYWPGKDNDITEYVDTCVICAQRKSNDE